LFKTGVRSQKRLETAVSVYTSSQVRLCESALTHLNIGAQKKTVFGPGIKGIKEGGMRSGSKWVVKMNIE